MSGVGSAPRGWPEVQGEAEQGEGAAQDRWQEEAGSSGARLGGWRGGEQWTASASGAQAEQGCARAPLFTRPAAHACRPKYHGYWDNFARAGEDCTTHSEAFFKSAHAAHQRLRERARLPQGKPPPRLLLVDATADYW